VPAPVGAGTTATRGMQTSSTSIDRSQNAETNIASIHVHTNATDAAGIARDIQKEMKRFDYAVQADSGLA